VDNNNNIVINVLNPKKHYYEHISMSPFNSPIANLYSTLHSINETPKMLFINQLKAALKLVNLNVHKTEEVDFLEGISSMLDMLLNIRYSKYITDVALLNYLDQSISLIIDRIINTKIEFKEGTAWKYVMNIGDEENFNYLNGFSHGVSGILAVLKKTAFFLKTNKLNTIIENAYLFERSLFNQSNNTWYDNRLGEKSRDIASWCHGSGGIALSKLLYLNFEKNKISSLSHGKITLDQL
jgi:lantibiotic modifying enzyme